MKYKLIVYDHSGDIVAQFGPNTSRVWLKMQALGTVGAASQEIIEVPEPFNETLKTFRAQPFTNAKPVDHRKGDPNGY